MGASWDSRPLTSEDIETGRKLVDAIREMMGYEPLYAQYFKHRTYNSTTLKRKLRKEKKE